MLFRSNILADVEDLSNITLYTVDELESVVSERIFARKQELPRASLIINETSNDFMIWLKTLSVTPTISDLKALFEQIKSNELSKIKSHYDNKTLTAIDLFSTSLMTKLLKEPIITLKTQASNGRYSPALVDAIRSIYHLDKTLEAAEQD